MGDGRIESMYIPVHISIYSRVQIQLRQMSRRFLGAQGDQRAFCMAGAWEMIHTMLGTDPRSSMYKHLSTTYQWPCHAKFRYQLAGILPFRFLIFFCYFQSAIPAKSFVHTNFRLVHINRKLYFPEGIAILRVCTAKRNREHAVCFSTFV